jgi:hypothetical protein
VADRDRLGRQAIDNLRIVVVTSPIPLLATLAGLARAASAAAAELPLYTTHPDDFAGLGHLVTVIPVTRPEVPNERRTK